MNVVESAVMRQLAKGEGTGKEMKRDEKRCELVITSLLDTCGTLRERGRPYLLRLTTDLA